MAPVLCFRAAMRITRYYAFFHAYFTMAMLRHIRAAARVARRRRYIRVVAGIRAARLMPHIMLMFTLLPPVACYY